MRKKAFLLAVIILLSVTACSAKPAEQPVLENAEQASEITEENNGETGEEKTETEEADAEPSEGKPTYSTEEWNGLPLCDEYDDYTFAVYKESTDLPFDIDFIINEDSVRYINREIETYGDSGETFKAYIPEVWVDALDCEAVIYLKDGADELFKNNCYVLVWNDDRVAYSGAVTENRTDCTVKIGEKYRFLIITGELPDLTELSGYEIYCVGELGFFTEQNNKVFPSHAYIKTNETTRYDTLNEANTANAAGYYRIAAVPSDFSPVLPRTFPKFTVDYFAKDQEFGTGTYGADTAVYISTGFSD